MELKKHTQEDHVREDQASRRLETKTKLAMPGIKTLHTRPLPEIAAALAAALRSRSDITELRYVVGEFIEVTVKDPD